MIHELELHTACAGKDSEARPAGSDSMGLHGQTLTNFGASVCQIQIKYIGNICSRSFQNAAFGLGLWGKPRFPPFAFELMLSYLELQVGIELASLMHLETILGRGTESDSGDDDEVVDLNSMD